ncbi:MAG TPA: hypothetical protein VKA01_01905 [Vicinamibacteria bacterium]|nr:hypothetical protein [Vicinamibacteria bacterium]
MWLALGEVEVSQSEDVPGEGVLAFSAQVTPAADRVRLELTPLDGLLALRGCFHVAIKGVCVRQHQVRVLDREARDVWVSVEAVELPVNAGEDDLVAFSLRERYLADLGAETHPSCVIEVGGPFVVPGSIGEDHGEVRPQVGPDRI